MSDNQINEDGECRIADAMNTYNPALRIIQSKAYKIFILPDERDDYLGDYWATKGSRDFIASDPLRLLGIIALWEALGDYWWANDKLGNEDVYDRILTRAFPDSVTDLEKLTDSEFGELLSEYTLFFERLNLTHLLPKNSSRQDFFKAINNFYKDE